MLFRDNIDPNPRPSSPSLDPYSEPSRVLEVIRKDYNSKLEYRKPLHLYTPSKQRAHITQKESTSLNICEVTAHIFDRLSCNKDFTMFNLTLQEIDRVIGIQAPPRTPPPLLSPSHLSSYFKSLTLDPKLCPQKKDR